MWGLLLAVSFLVGISALLVIYKKYVKARFLLHLCWFVTSIAAFGYLIAAAVLYSGTVGVVEVCEYISPMLEDFNQLQKFPYLDENTTKILKSCKKEVNNLNHNLIYLPHF